MLFLEKVHHVYPSIYYHSNPSCPLLHSTSGLCFLPYDPQDALFHELAPIVSHPDQLDPWLIILCNQSPAHQ